MNSRANLNRRANRSRIGRRQNSAIRSANKALAMQTIKVGGSDDPRTVTQDIIVDKLVEIAIPGGTTVVDYAAIYLALQQGPTQFFQNMIVLRGSFYSEAISGNYVNVVVFEDGAQFIDRGIGTARRPAVHLQFPFVNRANWRTTTDTTPVVTINIPSGTVGAIAQFTIRVRANVNTSGFSLPPSRFLTRNLGSADGGLFQCGEPSNNGVQHEVMDTSCPPALLSPPMSGGSAVQDVTQY